MKKILLLCIFSLSLWGNSVYSVTSKKNIVDTENALIKSFNNSSLPVVWKLDILNTFKKAGLNKTFGKKFNTARLTGVRTIIACNGKLGNDIMNADPKMMAFCPIRVTLTEKKGKTTVSYVRPSVATKKSKAHPILLKLERKVIAAIRKAMK